MNTYRILLGAVLGLSLALLAPSQAPAQGKPTFIADEHAVMQQWIDEVTLPTPARRIRMRLRGCSFGEHEISCSMPISGIWFSPLHVDSKAIFLHEFGHQMDYWMMTEGRRMRFARIIGQPYTEPSEWLVWKRAEWYASAWSLCARYPDDLPEVGLPESQYGWYPSRKRHRRVCGFFKALTVPKQPIGDRDFPGM